MAFFGQLGDEAGRPLSPLLFILASEAFSRGLKQLLLDGYITAFSMRRALLLITHLVFADDLLIFLNRSVCSVQQFRHFLDLYQAASGQREIFKRVILYHTHM